MPKYEVTADFHDVHKLHADGVRVLETKRYKRGDEITMDADEAERFLKTGGLRDPKSDEVAGPQDSVAPGAVSGQTAEQSLKADPNADGKNESEEGATGASDLEPVDGLTGLSYPDLQDAAKERGVPANQKAEDLRAAIRQYDADNA